jgi:hypothetical protein
MAASTAILADKLHEYPQLDVIDGTGGASASVLDDCVNSHDGVLQLTHRYAGGHFVRQVNAFALTRNRTIRTT